MDAPCAFCGVPIKEGDQGVLVFHAETLEVVPSYYYGGEAYDEDDRILTVTSHERPRHLDCWLAELGVKDIVDEMRTHE